MEPKMHNGDQAKIITHDEVRESLFRLRAVVAAAFDTGRKMSAWGSDLEAIDLALRYALQQKAKESAPPGDDWLGMRQIEDGMVVGKIDGAKL